MEFTTTNTHDKKNRTKSMGKNQSYKNRNKKVTCTTLSKNSVNKGNIQETKSLKNSPPQKQQIKSQIYVCKLCNLAFTAETKLIRHQKTHQYEKPHKCHQCHEDFNVLENLMLHSALHNKRPFRCPQCGKIFNRLSSLSGHIKSHFKNEYFTCSACGEMFHYESHLKEHGQQSHPISDVKRLREEKKATKKERHLARKARQLVCQFCGKEFKKNCLLERHERIHRGERPFKCDLCSAAFVQKHSLVIHHLKHTGEKPYKCDQCEQCFSQRGNLTSHKRNVHKQSNDDGDSDGGNDKTGNSFPCPQCTCSFKKLRTLNCHLGRFHARSMNLVAKVSSDKTNNNQKIFDNDLKSTSQQEIDDDEHFEYANVIDQLAQIRRPIIEPKIIETSKSTGLHVNQQSPPPKPPPTPINNTTIENSTLILAEYTSDGQINHRNVQQKIINNTRWLICLYCPKKFRRPSDLIRHARVHTKEKPFKCPHEECQRQFATKSILTVHMRVHEKNPPRYHCAICSRIFGTSQTLDFHYTTTHRYEYKCKHRECGSVLTSTTELKDHMNKFHNIKIQMLAFENDDDKTATVSKLLNDNDLDIDLSKIPPEMIIQRIDKNGSSDQISYEIVLEQSSVDKTFKCDICNKNFTRKHCLKQHLSRHLGLKPYKCLECGQSFSTSFILNRHRIYHSKIRKYQCDICKMKFSTADILKRHSVKHSDERKFMCEYCRKLFKTRATCRQHLYTHKLDDKNDIQQEIRPQPTVNVPTIQYTPPPMQKSQLTALPPPSSPNIPFIPPEIIEGCHEIPKAITVNFNGNITNEEIEYISGFNPIFDVQTNNDTQNTNLTTPNNSQLCFEIDGILTETITDNNNDDEYDNVVDVADDGVLVTLTPTFPIVATHPETETTTHDQDTQITDQLLPKQSIEQPQNINVTKNQKLPSEKKNKCTFCPKSFKKPIDFRRHMRTHTGERPFSCNQCEKSFTLLCVLNEHKKTHVTASDKIRFPCHVCNKLFGSKYSLNIHLRIHVGQKPYKCQYCTMSFRTTGHRQRHESIHIKKAAKSGLTVHQVNSQKFSSEEQWKMELILKQQQNC